MRKRWVLGLAFNGGLSKILLLKKNRGPEFNIGKWNGFGGSVDADETTLQAMVRESFEEVYLDKLDWVEVATLKTCNGDVIILACMTDTLHEARQMEDEEIGVFEIADLENIAYNLNWLIPMSISVLQRLENAKRFVIEEIY